MVNCHSALKMWSTIISKHVLILVSLFKYNSLKWKDSSEFFFFFGSHLGEEGAMFYFISPVQSIDLDFFSWLRKIEIISYYDKSKLVNVGEKKKAC